MEETPAPVIVDAARLSPGALRGLVDEFVTRSGTDYGAIERSRASKVAEVLAQIHRGEVMVVFDPQEERCELVTAEAVRRAARL